MKMIQSIMEGLIDKSVDNKDATINYGRVG